jgi:beta-mannanase
VYTLQGTSPVTAVTDLESEVGRRFDLTLRYHDFSTHPTLGVFPDASERTLGTNRTLFMSWQARVGSTNTNLKWADIANGSYDSFITSAATRLKAWNRPVIIAFDAEFDNLTSLKGPVSDYVLAYRRIVDMFRAAGVTNVAWAWVPTGYLGAGNDARTLAGYPGDSYVDWVGYDPYNFYKCNNASWKTFEQTIAPTYNWFVSKGLGKKPFLLSEYGTQYDSANPSASTQWYADIPGVLQRYPNLKGLIRFDADGVVNSGAHCNMWIDNGPGMKTAFANAGHSPITGYLG